MWEAPSLPFRNLPQLGRALGTRWKEGPASSFSDSPSERNWKNTITCCFNFDKMLNDKCETWSKRGGGSVPESSKPSRSSQVCVKSCEVFKTCSNAKQCNFLFKSICQHLESNAKQYKEMHCKAMQCNAKQCKTMQSNVFKKRDWHKVDYSAPGWSP